MSGESEIRRSMGCAREPEDADSEECPVVALGQRNGVYYFLSVAGERRELRARDLTQLVILSLFNGDSTWLFTHYAKLDRKDRPTGAVDCTAAAAALMRRCASVGLYRLDTPIRSIGVWRDPKLGVVAHCGDEIFYFEGGKRRRKRAGVHHGHAIYVAAPAIEPPTEQPATRDECRELMDQVRELWRYQAKHLGRLVFGFLAVALMGEAPSWRVHILLIGARGSGKSTLLKLIRAALGPQANYTNDPTEAGLRELLTDEARAIVYDEAGPGPGEQGSARIGAIVGLLRRMAADEGAKSVRGSGGQAKQYAMAGSAALAAANAPALDAQDRSRILEVDMLTADPDNLPAVEEAIDAAEKLSPALRARALAGFERFVQNLAVYRDALLASECDARQADQLGTLLAAAAMMCSDEPIAAEIAMRDVEGLAPVVAEYRAEDEEQSNARRCYSTLLSTAVEHWKGGAKSNIGRLVQLARDPSRMAEREALAVYGLRLEERADGAQELWIANSHRALERLFEGTPWAAGGHRRALMRLPGAEAGAVPRSFNGYKSRFIAIPERHLPEKPPAAPPVA